MADQHSTREDSPQEGAALRGSISERVCAAKAEIAAIPKNGYNPHGKYKHSTVDDVYHAIRPVLAKHGLDLKLDIARAEVVNSAKGSPWVHIEASIGFDGETAQRRFLMLPLTGAQAFEAANSYLQKQFLRARLQIETGEYDEEDMGKEAPPAPSPKREPPKPIAAQPPTDHETGEVLPPCLIGVPNTADGKPDWMTWGATLAAALKAAAVNDEIDGWMEQNVAPLSGCEQNAPKIHERLTAIIAAERERVAQAEAPAPNILAAG